MKITFLKAKKRLAKEITKQGSKPYPLVKNFTSRDDGNLSFLHSDASRRRGPPFRWFDEKSYPCNLVFSVRRDLVGSDRSSRTRIRSIGANICVPDHNRIPISSANCLLQYSKISKEMTKTCSKIEMANSINCPCGLRVSSSSSSSYFKI